jgi:hypothetical protein
MPAVLAVPALPAVAPGAVSSAAIRLATSTSTASPPTWPSASFTSLKRSRSTSSSAVARSPQAARASARPRLGEQLDAVAEPGELVVPLQVGELAGHDGEPANVLERRRRPASQVRRPAMVVRSGPVPVVAGAAHVAHAGARHDVVSRPSGARFCSAPRCPPGLH